MKCVNHPARAAGALCNRCGKSICPECQMQLAGENYCRDCIAAKTGTGETREAEHSPSLAAILSFVIAGLGQIYNGQPGKGLLIFFTGWLIIPWIIGIFDAYATAKKIRQGVITRKPRSGCIIAAVIGIAMFYFAILFIAILAAIAIPNLLRARLNANEASAQAILKEIAAAAESYAGKHEGRYPQSELDLTTQGYLPEAYNDRTTRGYSFSEEFDQGGYKITASPASCGVTGEKVFTISNSGVISSSECNKEEED